MKSLHWLLFSIGAAIIVAAAVFLELSIIVLAGNKITSLNKWMCVASSLVFASAMFAMSVKYLKLLYDYLSTWKPDILISGLIIAASFIISVIVYAIYILPSLKSNSLDFTFNGWVFMGCLIPVILNMIYNSTLSSFLRKARFTYYGGHERWADTSNRSYEIKNKTHKT